MNLDQTIDLLATHEGAVKAWESRRRAASKKVQSKNPKKLPEDELKKTRISIRKTATFPFDAKGVTKILQSLPQHHIIGLKSIQTDDLSKEAVKDLDVISYGSGSNDVNYGTGYYSNKIKGIKLNNSTNGYTPKGELVPVDSNSPEEVGPGIIHEIGHYVHASIMTPETAKEWKQIHTSMGPSRISEYARMSMGEHFAEAYMVYHDKGVGYSKIRDFNKEDLKLKEPKVFAFLQSLDNPSSKLWPKAHYISETAWWDRYITKSESAAARG